MAVTGKFRRAPDQSCSCCTIANVHINNECAKRTSVCIALLLLVRDFWLKLGAVVLTGDFYKAVGRETPSGDGERRTSQMEAAFRHTNIPRPTGGVTPLWDPGGEHNGKKWPDCCGFVVLPESQSQWLNPRHGSIDVVLAGTQARCIPCGLKVAPEDCTVHQEVSDWRRTCASEKVAVGHLGRPPSMAYF